MSAIYDIVRRRSIRALRRVERVEPADLPPNARRGAMAVTAILGAETVTPAVAAGVAVAVSDAMSRTGGPRCCDAICREAAARRRRRLILRDFDGRNHAELARRHRVSARTVRRIVDVPRRK